MNTEYKPEEIILQREQFAYGFIIEVLTQGLYPNKFHVIREYVQNSYDAILKWRRSSGDSGHGQIGIAVAPPSIFIYDDGIGMDHTKVNQYRYVGYSEKRAGEGVGFRGIGKLSGISVADKLIVTSSPVGVPERYKLVFDANEMLDHILELKQYGENIPLNDLIRIHTDITTEDEETSRHYTLVELFNVRTDSQGLMTEEKLEDYLSMNAPVDFDPGFPYADIVDEWLREYVPDYDTAPIYLNGSQIFKPYPQDLKLPQMRLIFDDSEQAQPSEEDSEHIAFYWYCEHAEKGQFDDRQRCGLRYRVKNFAVGDNWLPRRTWWTSRPHLAFYFFGEIHVCNPDVIPSSARDDFEQNEARERLYKLAQREIRLPLSRIASKSSARRRAREYVIRAEETVRSVRSALDAGQLPREVKLDKTYEVRRAVEEVKKRLPSAEEDFRERGEEIIKKGHELRKQLEGAEANEPIEGVYDIKKALNFGPDTARVYEIIMACLRDEFADEPKTYERLVKRVHISLEERY